MWISFDGIINVRDLGGIPAADGRHVQYGRLLRGAGLENASDADLLRLQEEYRLAEVIDFRMERERRRHPDRPVAGAAMRNFPTGRGDDGGPVAEPEQQTEAEPDFAGMFFKIYKKFAEDPQTTAAYRSFFDVLLSRPAGAVYFHCAQGKDRTGLAAILALTALGADWADIEADFFRSNEALGRELDSAETPGSEHWSQWTKEHLFLVYPENLAAYLERIEARWGGLDGYLRRGIGLTEDDIAALRREYLE